VNFHGPPWISMIANFGRRSDSAPASYPYDTYDDYAYDYSRMALFIVCPPRFIR